MYHDFEHASPHFSHKTGVFGGLETGVNDTDELRLIFRVGWRAYALHPSWATRIGCHKIESGKITFVSEWKPVDASQAAEVYDLLTEIQWRDGKKMTQALKERLQKSREYLYKRLHLTPLEQIAVKALETHRVSPKATQEALLKKAAEKVRSELSGLKQERWEFSTATTMEAIKDLAKEMFGGEAYLSLTDRGKIYGSIVTSHFELLDDLQREEVFWKQLGNVLNPNQLKQCLFFFLLTPAQHKCIETNASVEYDHTP